MTSEFDVLSSMLKKHFPKAGIAVEKPLHPRGIFWLDLRVNPNRAAVEWSEDRGFGVSVNSDVAYGEGSNEYYASAKAAFDRIAELLKVNGRTEAADEQFLRALREGRKMTQAQMAKVLKVKQASVSRLERRTDFHLSTMRNMVERLGGRLEIRAAFDDGRVQIMSFGPEGKRKAKGRKGAVKPSPGGVAKKGVSGKRA